MAVPTVEVVGIDQLKEGKNISTDIGLILEVILKVNWKEPALIILIVAHFVTLLLILLVRKRPYILAGFLVVLGVLCLLSEQINEFAAANHRYFLSDQYFDSAGVFISIVLAIPLLLNCFVILVCLLIESCSTMQKVAQLKIKAKQKIKDTTITTTITTIVKQNKKKD